MRNYIGYTQIAVTAAVLLASVAFFEWSHIDIRIQEYFYNDEAHRWIVDRADPVIELLAYSGIKQVFFVFVLSIAGALLFFGKNAVIRSYKPGLLIFLLSAVAIPLAANGLKAITNVPCPRDIARFGGNAPYVTVTTEYPADYHQTGNFRCFPAGHASGGFSLMALFFLFKTRRARRLGLAIGLAAGWATGTYKMLIGDHFLSHTVFTMIMAWLLILVIAKCVGHYAPARRSLADQ